MCLQVKSLEPHSQPIKCYKVYRMNLYYHPGDISKGQLDSQFQSTGIRVEPLFYGKPFSLCHTKAVISNRLEKHLYDKESRTSRAFQGIHVFLTEENAIIFASYIRSNDCFVVEVECHPEDFVAAGLFDDMKSAVYMKVMPLRIVAKKPFMKDAVKLD